MKLDKLAEVAATLTKGEVRILVIAERGRVTKRDLDQLHIPIETITNLVAAGLLIPSVEFGMADAQWTATLSGRTCAEVHCPKCCSLMSSGKALVGAPQGITYEGEWPVKFSECLKCHSCGYSEQLQN